MTELERALVGLGTQLDLPGAPDVTAAVLRRISEAPARRRFPARRALVLAVVVLAVAIGAVMAVPPARTAVLELFGLRGATVRRVDTLPAVPRTSATALELGKPVSSASLDGFLVPAALGTPDAVYRSSAIPGGKVSLVYRPGPDVPRSLYTGVGILVTEFRGDLDPVYIEKFVGSGTGVEQLEVDGSPALWIEGEPHLVLFTTPGGSRREDLIRLAGNTLLVQRGDILVRIEGEIDRERAVAIAESLGLP
jgi:hypothetical protein